MKTFTGMSDIAVNPDGMSVTLNIETSEGASPLKIPIAEISRIVQVLGFASSEAGRLRGMPEAFSLGEQVNFSAIRSTAMGLVPGPYQHVVVMFRVGAWDFGVEVPVETFRDGASHFQKVAEMLATEPKQVQ